MKQWDKYERVVQDHFDHKDYLKNPYRNQEDMEKANVMKKYGGSNVIESKA